MDIVLFWQPSIVMSYLFAVIVFCLENKYGGGSGSGAVFIESLHIH